MLKKRDIAREFLKNNDQKFRCPTCHSHFSFEHYQLVCAKNHHFDLSKKGTIYFPSHSIQTDYNKKMFMHRGRMIQSGAYQPLLEAIFSIMNPKGMTLDVGCGEGSFLAELTKLGVVGTKIGFDLSKEGIYLASEQQIEAFWCVADLTNLPFETHSVDTILNIFSPSQYNEFRRVLKRKGSIIKIVPEANYLNELRSAFYPNNYVKQSYSNDKVIAKFFSELDVVEDHRITYTFPIPERYRLDVLEMSPLEWGVSSEIKKTVQQHPIETITIDVRVLKGQKK